MSETHIVKGYTTAIASVLAEIGPLQVDVCSILALALLLLQDYARSIRSCGLLILNVIVENESNHGE